ncbi:MAG TPA: hypothetical protein VFE07_06095 [Marmoricola sp.]|nr:hypothetical protein [Marmoricola sp.]
MKYPSQRRVAIAALLLAPALASCGFNEQTDQVYQAAVGINDRSGEVDILNALIVSGEDGSGTFAGTLVNKDQTNDDTLDSVTGPGITSPSVSVEVPAAGVARLAVSGDVSVTGSAVKPGNFVELTLAFASGQTTTVKVPVVEAGGDYANVPLPRSSPSDESSSGSGE